MEAEVDVNLVTDEETTEPDPRRAGHQGRPEGFDGFETSVLDSQPTAGAALPEKGSFAPSPESV